MGFLDFYKRRALDRPIPHLNYNLLELTQPTERNLHDMRFSTLIVALFATIVTADPILSNRGVSQLSTPFLDKRSDTVLTPDGRLISRQDVRMRVSFEFLQFYLCILLIFIDIV